jgi:glutaredoxin-related protein
LGITPLHYACYFGSRKVIDYLLDLGADINSQDQENNTCLHYAINSGCSKTVKKMLIRGADKRLVNHEGKTPYDLAKEMNNYEIASILESKSFVKKFICMGSELSAFEPSRNDLFLMIALLVLIIFKLVYILKIYYLIIKVEPQSAIINDSSDKRTVKGTKITDYVQCTVDGNCLFEIITTFLSFASDTLVFILLVYFMCFAGEKHLKLLNKKQHVDMTLVVI